MKTIGDEAQAGGRGEQEVRGSVGVGLPPYYHQHQILWGGSPELL